MKKFIIIAASVLTVLALAVAGLWLFISKNQPATAEEIISNTVTGIFGELYEITEDGPKYNRLNNITASAGIPAEALGIEKDLTVSSELVHRDNNGKISLRAETGSYALNADSCIIDGHFDMSVTVKNGYRNTSFATGLEIKGCADAFDKSEFNPDVNPDSPLSKEQYEAIREIWVRLEELYGKACRGDDDEADSSVFSEKLEALYENLKKLPKYEKVKDGGTLLKPDFTLTVTIGPGEISEGLRLITDFFNDEEVQKYLDAINSFADETEAESGEASSEPVSSSGTDKAALGDGTSGAGSSATDEAPAETGSAEEEASDPDFEELCEELEKAGISVKAIVKVAEERLVSVNVAADFTVTENETGAETDAGTDEGTVTSGTSGSGTDEEKKVAYHSEFSIAFDYETREITASFINDYSEKSDDEPEKLHLDFVLDCVNSGAWTLKNAGSELAAGKFTVTSSALDFTVDSAGITYTDVKFNYGEGLVLEEKAVTAENIFTLHADTAAGDFAPPENSKDFFELSPSEVNEQFEEKGVVAEAISVLQTVTSYCEPYTFQTADGVIVTPKDKTEQRAKEILNAYLNYVNKVLGSKAFTLDSAYVWLYDEESCLYYVIDASDGKALTYVFAQISEDIVSSYHMAVLRGSNFKIHSFTESTPEIGCGEKIYTLHTCSDCGFQVVRYTGAVKEHNYSEKLTAMKTAESPAAAVSVTVKECLYCGELTVYIPSEYYSVMYEKNGEGYTAKKLSFDYDHFEWRQITVAMPEGYTGKITEIADNFIYNANKQSIYGIYIADGVKTIGSQAFMDAYVMRDIMLPATLEKIGDGAFDQCRCLNAIHYCSSASDWEKIDKCDSEGYLSGVKIYCDCRQEPEYFSNNTLKLSDFVSINNNMSSVRSESLKNMKYLLSSVSGVTIAEMKNIQYRELTGIWNLAIDNKTGSVAVANWSGDAGVYNSAGKYLGNIPQSFYRISAGEGYILSASSEWIAAYDALTLEEVLRVEPDKAVYGNEFSSPVIYKGVIYVSSTEGIVSVNTADKTVNLFSTDRNATLILDRSKGLLYYRCYSKVYIHNLDTGETQTVEKCKHDYNKFDGTGMIMTSVSPEWTMITGKNSDGSYKETNLGANIYDYRFGPVGTDENGNTLYGSVYVSAATAECTAGYTPYRLMYSDEQSEVSIAYNASFKVSTVISYNGKTKVVPIVTDYVTADGNGRFAFWSEDGQQAAIIDMNK